MMYKKNFVAAIKVGGKVLRESNDRVELPFGSEYSILLKNLDSVRVRASIQIDGSDAVEGLVIQPNSEIEIERFLRSTGSLDQGNRFKFIERTAKIEDHRGIKADDGLVRVEFEREKVFNPPIQVVHHTYTYPYVPPTWINTSGSNSLTDMWKYSSTSGPGFQGQMTNSSAPSPRTMLARSRRGGYTGQTVHADYDAEPISASVVNEVLSAPFNYKFNPEPNEAGITVEGSVSSQKFVPVQGFECETPDVVVLHLIGRKQGTPIQVAKTVRAKVACTTCGTKNKSSVKFCKECGTSLEKV